ncbi:MAG: ParB/RepB/Spo0J family partition protein [Thaumarchaeota archaeon]|nr:ParB/RepB/Spo0J family partition protein [Nitrososphaerota archaeon]MDE1866527.1 ParB/RepB/Spo0J family partition protein [Nitrososphaerota archaeon]
MKIKNIPLKLIDIADENVRKDHPFGEDTRDRLIKDHLSKFELLQPVVVRFDSASKRYKLLIGRRRFLSLSAKGTREIPAVVTELEGAEAEAASLFENLIRKDLPPLEKARMVRKLVDSTESGITGVSRRYGLSKSTVSEWLSILTLAEPLQQAIESEEITLYEAIQIARKPKAIQEKLVNAVSDGKLQEVMIKTGVKRGAPKGLLTVRLVFNPKKKFDKKMWDQLNVKASQNGLEVTDFVKNLLIKHLN